ncbi:helix-turn-helix domain-containing protein, partial [Enterocloster sp.]
FTMVDLADYLSIDRSAMTRELKKMKDEKLVEIDRKSIRLLV